MSGNPTNSIDLVKEKRSSTQLLFFDTLTARNFSSNESLTESIECIRFNKRVVLSDIRVVPNNFRPFKGSRKDHVGKTSPNKFELHLLIHKTLTSDSSKLLEKRPPTLPLHPLTISFDEKKGYLSYDVTLTPEATTRFIILRGNYHAVTLCVYGKVVEANRINASKINNSINSVANEQVNKEGNGESSIQNGTTDSITLNQSMQVLKPSSKILPDNQGKTIVEQNSGEIKMETNITRSHENFNQNSSTMDIEMTMPFTGSISNNNIDISDTDRVGILLRNERPGAFRIPNPLNSLTCLGSTSDEKGNKDILVDHVSPDETLLSFLSHSFSDIKFKKAWDNFSSHIESLKSLLHTIKYNTNRSMNHVTNKMAELIRELTDVFAEGVLWARFQGVTYDGVLFALDISSGKSSIKLYESGLGLFKKLCVCGEDLINTSMVHSCLKLMVPLLNEQYVSSTLQAQILQGLLKCIDETRVVENLIGWIDRTHSYDSLYKTYILPMLQMKRLPVRILHLLQWIVRKVSVYEACTLIQQVADNELLHENEIRSKKKKLDESTYENTEQHNTNFMIDDDANVHVLDNPELAIEQLCDCLQIISRVSLYYMALNSPENENQDKLPIFSFRYLTNCRVFPALTVILSSQRFRSCLRFHELVNSIGRFCIILLGEQIGMLYLAKQLQQPREPFGDNLLAIWSSLLCHQHEVTESFEETEYSNQNLTQIINEKWTDANEIRRTPGIGDIWCGLDPNLKKARQILRMQSFGAIGIESDFLDNFVIPSDQLVILLVYHINSIAIIERLLELGRPGSDNTNDDYYQKVTSLLNELFEMTTFNVGKQAVISTIIHLDALPILVSFMNINSIHDNNIAIGRISMELLEAVIKFSPAYIYFLSNNVNELLPSLISSESHLRILWDPIVAFHETGNVQGVIDIIKHQKYYPECLREQNTVNQILISLKLLICYTYSEEGILQILGARMDDFSGFDNGDSLFVFLSRLLNYAAEVLSDMSDFVVYADHQTTNDSTLIEIDESNNTGIQDESKIFELRKELLDLVWYNLILMKKLLKVIYGDPNSSVAKRHFKDIYGKGEFPDDSLPSQKKSMIQICLDPWLMLISALDHLDGRLSDQLGAISLLVNDQPMKYGQSAQIARLRGLLMNTFGLLTQVIIEDNNSTINNTSGDSGDSKCRARFFSEFTGRHVVKQLIDFIFEGPNNFLSGLHILSEILPTPLLTNLKKDNYFDNYEMSDLDDVLPEAKILRNYWVNQLIPLRDDLMQLTKSLASSSSKIIHIMLRTLICQLVDLDVYDRGIGRGIMTIIVNGVREVFLEIQSILDKVGNGKLSNNNELEENSEQNDGTKNSNELDIKLSLFGRWLSLLTSLGSNSLGRAHLIDYLSGNSDIVALEDVKGKKASENSLSLVPMLLNFINTNNDLNFIYDFIMEFLFSICNHSITVSGSRIPKIDDLALIIDTLLVYVKQGKNGRLQAQSLLVLQKIVETEIGVLIVLTEHTHYQLIGNIITWAPELIRSSDLRMQDLNIAYNSIVFILKIIAYSPHRRSNSPGTNIEEFESLSLVIDSNEDLEILHKTYESIEQYVLDLPYKQRNENDEEIIYDLNMCRSVASVIQSLKDQLISYAHVVSRSNNNINREEILKKLNIRKEEVIREFDDKNCHVNQGFIGSRSVGFTIDDYPEIPFYDVVDDPAGKGTDGGLFNEPDIDIDFEVFAKEMLPNFQFHKKMKMSSDSAAKGRKLLKARTLSKLGGIAYESNARRNLGGGKTYQKNEFRSIHNNRKANTSRPPSVHVDDFMSGKIPVNQQHPDMLNTASTTTAVPTPTPTMQQKKLNPTNRPPTPNKRGGIATPVISPQITTSNRGGRGRRPSTVSVPTPRGVSRGGSSSGRGVGGIGRGGNTNAGIIGTWEMGGNTGWAGGPPSLPIIMPPPISKYMEFDRQRDYARYDSQNMRAGYYDNQYYGIPSPITPYDRPPVQQSTPGIGPRIKNGGENRGRTVPQEWPPRSMTSQQARRPERPFGRR
ncbi:795_t:CDS:10 [Diversispora eburnea]|uniref:795_t:CDS:1 n=1 Tax=Diversispora eburnea TaxID=1213867 RepID=A0A9N8YWT5_9GLOM|nr:795_t:CDS:10 [Diversispora eburnea]